MKIHFMDAIKVYLREKRDAMAAISNYIIILSRKMDELPLRCLSNYESYVIFLAVTCGEDIPRP
jgi:hypothetical protein